MNDLFLDGVVDWAYWILHYADNDDKKDHIHFVFQPSKALETFDFMMMFLEFPFHGVNRRALKPLSRFNPVSSLDDWLLYCKHDVDYLANKGLHRTYFYEWDDFLSTDQESFLHDVGNIDRTNLNRLSFLQEGVLNDIPFAQLVQSGQIPINFRAQYQAQYRALRKIKLSQIYTDKKLLRQMLTVDQQLTF